MCSIVLGHNTHISVLLNATWNYEKNQRSKPHAHGYIKALYNLCIAWSCNMPPIEICGALRYLCMSPILYLISLELCHNLSYVIFNWCIDNISDVTPHRAQFRRTQNRCHSVVWSHLSLFVLPCKVLHVIPLLIPLCWNFILIHIFSRQGGGTSI